MGVLTADGQFHGPWNADVAWRLEDDVLGSWGAVASMEEGEMSKAVLIGSKGVMGQADDNGEHPFIR
jgi:hypothetical protein